MTFGDGEICSFCLGGNTDVPPFGNIHDAEDLIHPCSTCNIITHKKCLLDWFNSLPSDKLTRTYPFDEQFRESFPTGSPINANVEEILIDSAGEGNETDNDDDDDDDIESDGDLMNQLNNLIDNRNPANNNGNAFNANHIEINISLGLLNRWINNFVSDVRRELRAATTPSNTNNANSVSAPVNQTPILEAPGPEPTPHHQNHTHTRNHNPNRSHSHLPEQVKQPFDGFTVLLSAPCPQCKSNITFCMRRSLFLTLNTLTRTSISDLVQYGGVFLGLTGAATGIITMGYVGLARLGLNVLDCLIPSPLLMSMLSRKNHSTLNSIRSFFPITNQSITTLEDIFTKGLVDQFKFSHIPILPIVMYRMRSSSITSCLFLTAKQGSKFNDWIAEFMISNFISSLGSHQLLRGLLLNLGYVLKSLTSLKLSQVPFELVKNINVWDPNIMIGLLVPTRWLYDLFYRLTINRLHFNLATHIRPRDIANIVSEDELSLLEDLQTNLTKIEFKFKHKDHRIKSAVYSENPGPFSINFITSCYRFLKYKLSYYKSCVTSDLPLTYMKLKLISWYHNSKACLKNDYSLTLVSKSLTIRAVTTFIWPLISADFGRLIGRFILNEYNFKTLSSVPKDRVVMMSNLIGLVVVVALKDLVNVYLSSRKVQQLNKMTIVKTKLKLTNNANNDRARNNSWSDQLPGNFPRQ